MAKRGKLNRNGLSKRMPRDRGAREARRLAQDAAQEALAAVPALGRRVRAPAPLPIHPGDAWAVRAFDAVGGGGKLRTYSTHRTRREAALALRTVPKLYVPRVCRIIEWRPVFET